jgi:gas vesicle protein
VRWKLSNGNSWSSFGYGMALGLFSGLCLAILFVPKSGEENRQMVKDGVTSVGDRIREATADRKKVYTKTWNQGKTKPYAEEFE